jgi:hypothetical protein
MNAQYYDLNIWGARDNALYLTAYEWEFCPTGGIQMNSGRYHAKEFTDRAEIEFLLGDLWLNHYPFTDYDQWRDLEELYNSNTPTTIRQFLEALPPYEVPGVSLTERENA